VLVSELKNISVQFHYLEDELTNISVRNLFNSEGNLVRNLFKLKQKAILLIILKGK
jgi:hypothetical protein